MRTRRTRDLAGGSPATASGFRRRPSQDGARRGQGVLRRPEQRFAIAVDASPIVAILRREAGFDALVEALKAADEAVTSPLAVFERRPVVRRRRFRPHGYPAGRPSLIHTPIMRNTPRLVLPVGLAHIRRSQQDGRA